MTDPRVVVLVAFDGVQPVDLVGPHEVFASANTCLAAVGRPPAYEVRVAAVRPGIVRSESGLGLVADTPLPPGPVDTVIVPGGDGARRTSRRDPHLLSWLRRTAANCRRLCSVCTGTFVLAEAGLLDGHRVTTHWARAAQLADEYPGVDVDPAPLFIHEGKIWTSAGVSAGIDLSLALVEEDLGPRIAQTIARWMVLFLRRSGGQSQFASEVWTEPPERNVLRAVVRAIHAEPAADHSAPRLAERANLSVRHLQRSFLREIGQSPGAYVTRVRVDAAQRLLETEPLTVDAVARRCGFGSAETMRRAFQRHLGIPPEAYRDRFRTDAVV